MARSRLNGIGCVLSGLIGPTLVTAGCGQGDPHGEALTYKGGALTSVSAASRFLDFAAPAGDRPTTRNTTIDGRSGAILPNGRFVTPVGIEVDVQAPKPFGLASSPDGDTLATINSGASKFSVTLIRHARAATPLAVRVNLDATFMGLVFSPDGRRFYASGGDNGNLWIGDVASGQIIGSVNLNGATHPLDRPLAPAATPALRFKGAFPGNMALSSDGRYLYVVDQGGFAVHAVDTTAIVTGVDTAGGVVEPDNFASVVGRTATGRYPFGVALAPDDRTLFVTNVGVFQYTHLRPAVPVGNNNDDYPLCIPGVGYPDEVESAKTITIKRIDAATISGLPATQRDPDGIRCGYVSGDRRYTIPALGSPNAPESSSVYALSLADPRHPVLAHVIKTGPRIGDVEDGIKTYGGSHPNAVVAGRRHVYVSNGNNDTVTVLDGARLQPAATINLSVLRGSDARLKGVQPVSLALSPDEHLLFVAEAGLNAIGVVRLDGSSPRVLGHIPAGWWPSSVKVSADGHTLFVADAKGRGAGPNTATTSDQSPKHSVSGTVHIISLPRTDHELDDLTAQVLRNNGLSPDAPALTDHDDGERSPIPTRAGVASRQIRHVIFINKENATHDLLLGDITATRRGAPVNGNPDYSLGPIASPNHHELALQFTVGDNFYLEPTVSSDGHRWLTNTYTTENEETHWPASYGGKRRDSGDDPEVIAHYPGRVGFTDADASPEPNDLNQHGGIYKHLQRNGRTFVNFGNGYEFAVVDEDRGTQPTGIRGLRRVLDTPQQVRQGCVTLAKESGNLCPHDA